MHVDLNCDVGESFGRYKLGDDASMLKLITSANIACGFHAGDPQVMRRTVALAKMADVAIGAHPGYPDRLGFGRRAMDLPSDEVCSYLLYQLGALEAFTRLVGASITYVKLHGAFYHLASEDADVAAAVVKTLIEYNRDLILISQPSSALSLTARGSGLRVAYEGFPHRGYDANGQLLPYDAPGTTIHDREQIIERAVRMAKDGLIYTVDGKTIPMKIHTLCVQNDVPDAVQIATELCAALQTAGVEITPLPELDL